MKFDKKELLSVLKLLKPGSEGMLENLNVFLFRDNHVYTFNDKIFMLCPFESDVEFCVSSKMFFDVIQKTKDVITINKLDRAIEIKSGKLKSVIQEIPFDAELPDISGGQWDYVPNDFIQGLSLCVFSTTTDLSMSPLHCVSVQKDILVSSDNFRVSRYFMNGIMKNMCIPGSFVLEMLKISAYTEYCIIDDWLFLKTDTGIVFGCRVLFSDYPNTEKIFEYTSKKTLQLPKDILQAIDACKVFSDDVIIDKKMIVDIDNGKIKCKSENHAGWLQHTNEIDTEEKIQFQINPLFFEEVLAQSNSFVLEENRIIFAFDNFEHVVALC